MKGSNINKILCYLLAVMMFTSCTKDFLDQKPTSSLNESYYYKDVAELETGLIACYAALRSWGFDANEWSVGDVNSDDADCGSLYTDQPDLYNLSYSRQNPSNSWVQGAWIGYYAIIARCNQVIDRSSGTFSGTLGDSLEILKIVNQARFLRALSYYHLVTDFGDVPLVTKFLKPDELNLKKAPADSVLKQIESDLKDATNLPLKSEWNEPGRATSGAAWSLLGKVYLTEKKYEQANRAFYKVVSSNEYNLVPDFGFIFRKDGENCNESIFEMQTKNHIENGNLGTWSGAFRMPRDNGAGGWGFDCPTQDLFNEFEAGDPRIIYTFMFPGDVFPFDGTYTYTVENFASPTGYNSRKAWIPWSERIDLGWWDWAINYRYMRYAEVLLLYAESLNEINKPDSALLLLNQVRARARNTPASDPQRISCAYDLSYAGTLLPDVTTTDQTQLRNAIWHEQRVELAIEGHRRNMLLRTKQFKERMEKAKEYAGVTVEPHELLLPIPQQEIVLSNNILIQNSGY